MASNMVLELTFRVFLFKMRGVFCLKCDHEEFWSFNTSLFYDQQKNILSFKADYLA